MHHLFQDLGPVIYNMVGCSYRISSDELKETAAVAHIYVLSQSKHQHLYIYQWLGNNIKYQ
jgi:hypothetical protein